MDSKQFAWLYLVENGTPWAGHSYYGGYDKTKNAPESLTGWNWPIDARQLATTKIKQIGVDWRNSAAPESDSVSTFNGTFNDPGQTEIMTGVLALKNGERIPYVGDKLEVTNVFDMMAKVHEATARFYELFGD